MARDQVPYARFDAVNKESPTTLLQFIVGGIISSVFSMVYVIAPLSVLMAMLSICMWSNYMSTWILVSVLVMFSSVPPSSRIWILKTWAYRQMAKYFDYSEIHEVPDSLLLESPHKYVVAAVPHGIISFGGLCSATCDDEWTCSFSSDGIDASEWRPRRAEIMENFSTAVASVVLRVPILNHVMGIFGLVDASKRVLAPLLGSKAKSLIIYIGGIAEMFKSCSNKEVILTEHKGFVRLALEQGADVLPVYFMGNTTVLSLYKHTVLEKLSRKLSTAVTCFWGWKGTVVPRPKKILYLRGRPLSNLGMPVGAMVRSEGEDEAAFKLRLMEATDKWHAVLLDEIQRIFDTYKQFHPDFKNKTLEMPKSGKQKKKE